MCFYQDILNNMVPKYGILETDIIEIERSTGSNFIECKAGNEEFTIPNTKQHYPQYYWNQNFVGLKCRLYKDDGTNYIKEYNIANLIKKVNNWKYLTKKRLDVVKVDLREMNGTKVGIENTSAGFRIKDLEEILKKKQKKKEKKSTVTMPQKKVSFSFESVSDNGLKITIAEYAKKKLTGKFPRKSILKRILVNGNATDKEDEMLDALLKEVANRWKH